MRASSVVFFNVFIVACFVHGMEQDFKKICLFDGRVKIQVPENLIQQSGSLKDSLLDCADSNEKITEINLPPPVNSKAYVVGEAVMVAKALAYAGMRDVPFGIPQLIEKYTLKHLMQYAYICDKYSIETAQSIIHERIKYLAAQEQKISAQRHQEIIDKILKSKYISTGLTKYLRTLWYPLEWDIKPGSEPISIAGEFVRSICKENERVNLSQNAQLLISPDKEKIIVFDEAAEGIQHRMYSASGMCIELEAKPRGSIVKSTAVILPNSSSILVNISGTRSFYDIETMKPIDCPVDVSLDKLHDLVPTAPIVTTGFHYCGGECLHHRNKIARQASISFYRRIYPKLRLFFPLVYVSPDGSKALTGTWSRHLWKYIKRPVRDWFRYHFGGRIHIGYPGFVYSAPRTRVVYDVATCKRLCILRFHDIAFSEKSSIAICSTYPQSDGIKPFSAGACYKVVALHGGKTVAKLQCDDTTTDIIKFAIAADDSCVYGITRTGKLYKWLLRDTFRKNT
ncbi:MAG: hypothetical protein WC707_06665 [Candidatus Babeliaceae bacterium]|jgi:hypothetical protein